MKKSILAHGFARHDFGVGFIGAGDAESVRANIQAVRPGMRHFAVSAKNWCRTARVSAISYGQARRSHAKDTGLKIARLVLISKQGRQQCSRALDTSRESPPFSRRYPTLPCCGRDT